MKPSEQELVDSAALLAVGALDEAEVAAIQWRLDKTGDAVRDEAAAFLETAAALAESVVSADPPQSVKARLFERIDETPQRPRALLLDEDGVLILRSAEIPWRPHQVAGVAVKQLHVDQDSGHITSLVRFDPGVVYPAHAHVRDEELLVLSGDLEIQSRRMGPGDYCRGEAGSTHGSAVSRSGALLLVRNSAADRILP